MDGQLQEPSIVDFCVTFDSKLAKNKIFKDTKSYMQMSTILWLYNYCNYNYRPF